MNGFKEFKFSIIIPNYNGGKFLQWCIESILVQKYNNYELIIVDWKSSDNSHKIIKKYTGEYKDIIWIQDKDVGISNAFNIWIKKSSGDFVLYLWSDDYLYNDILEKINMFLNQILFFNQVSVDDVNIFCDSINYWSNMNRFEKREFSTINFNKKNLLKFWTIVWLQNIFLNSKWLKKNLLDEDNKYSMDYEIYFRMLESKQLFFYLPEVSSINYQWDNISNRYADASFYETMKVAKKYAQNFLEYIYIYKKIIIYKSIKIIKKWLWLLKR
jgi:glycosyltransferase involved in cell wall biosynthesis